ncbi:resolvase domain protein [Erwinia sp. Ejp617]|nr:resolvase domain protein [Erwinia sp. Ejp617]
MHWHSEAGWRHSGDVRLSYIPCLNISGCQRQKQRIERAHSLGKYRGKQADLERYQKVLYYRLVKNLSIREIVDAPGYSAPQVCRIQVFL